MSKTLHVYRPTHLLHYFEESHTPGHDALLIALLSRALYCANVPLSNVDISTPACVSAQGINCSMITGCD